MLKLLAVTHHLLHEKLKIRTFLLLILCMWGALAVCAQNKDDFKVKNEGLLKVTNYLPNQYRGHAQNWSFAQDKRGVMYVGNISGVLQYDGSQWRQFPIEDFQVAKDQAGRIYTALGYLRAGSAGHVTYQSLAHLLSKKNQQLAQAITRKIIVTPDFVAFHKIGSLFLYQKGKISTYPLSPDFIRPMLAIDQVLHMVKEGSGLMKLTGNTIAGKQWALVPGGEVFADKKVMAALPWGNQKWLLATAQHGLYTLDRSGFKPWKTPSDNFLKNNVVTCGLVLNKTQIALGTSRNGVLIINKTGEPIQHINQRNGLQDNYVKTLFLDKDKALWLALNKGISRVEITSPFSFWNQSIGLKGSLNHVAQLHQGKFYMATSQGVFYREKTDYINPLSSELQFKFVKGTKGSVFFVLATPEGVLCAHRNGIFLVNDSSAQKLVSTNSIVYTFIQLRASGNKYALAGTSRGMLLLEKKGATWQYKGVVKGHEKYTRYMHEGANGDLWITSDHGIYRITLSPLYDRVIEKKLYTEAQGLPAKKDNRAFGLSNGTLVLATTKGIYLYDKSSDRFAPHPLFHKQLKLNNHLQWIKEDQQKNLWFWGKTGVVLAKKSGRQSYITERKLFDKYKALFSNYMAPHVLPIDAQNILFETRDGVVHYNSSRQRNYTKPYEVLIRKVNTHSNGQDSLIFGGNFSNSGHDIMLSNQPAQQKHTLAYRFRNLSFSFSAIYFEDSHKTQYQHLLENFERKWSGWSNENKKEYTNLPPGEYTFRVKARNVYGAISREASYTFVVATPWYRTVEAYVLYIVLAMLFVWGIVHLNTRRLKHQKVRLELLIQKRTKEIQLKNETLESQKQEITQQAESLTEQADFLKEANEEVLMQRDQLDQTYKNVQLLSEIGKELTSTLSIGVITQIVYKHIQHLMDAEEFGIGYYMKKQGFIDFDNYIHKAKVLPPLSVPMANKNRLSVHCIDHSREIILGDLPNEYTRYVDKLEGYENDILLNSMICLPLIADQEVIGLVSVQSSKKNAYNAQQISLLRSLAVYIAIALKNASSYSKIAHQHIQITDSIRYAQNIQHTILPNNQVLSACFKAHFIVYQPKDIVSGDFYWVLQTTHPQTSEQYTFMAVIDCTGHGVPGALMSMVGYQLLNEIVKQMRVIEPNLILELLDQLVVTSLRQQVSHNTDGMDVCLCRLKSLPDGATEVAYSGAKNNLIVVEDNTLKVIKADRKGVGGFFADKDNKFTKTTLRLSRGSMLYMSSDGIRDLPNHERRSFGSQRFHQLIQANASLDLATQKTVFEQALKDFLGAQEPRDDITLFAVRV